MKAFWRLAGLAIAALALGSCATYLKTSKVTDTSKPLAGYPYHLKFTQFDITITRRVVGCSSDSVNGLKLRLDTKVDFAPKTTLDPSQFYVIDPRNLANGFKTVDATFEWNADLSLKSVSATVEDQTVTVASNVIAAAGKIAMLALAPGGNRKKPADFSCNDADAKIAAVDTKKKAVDAAKARLDEATLQLKLLTEKAVQMGNAVDKKTREALSRAIDLVKARTDLLAGEQAALEKALAAVSVVSKLTWPTTGDEWVSSAPNELTDADMVKLGIGKSDTRGRMSVYFRITPHATAGSGDQTEWRGLPYREPATAKIEACPDPACSSVLASKQTLMLQAGTMFVLPFESPALGSTKVSAGFDDTGALKTAGYAQTKAPAVAASSILKDAADQASTTMAAVGGARTKALQAKAAALQAEAAVRDAEASLDNQKKSLAAKSFSADAALAQAEISALQAQQQLAVTKSLLAN